MYQTFFQLFYFSNFVFGCGLLYVVHVFNESPQTTMDTALVNEKPVEQTDMFNQASDLKNQDEGRNRG